MTLLCSYGRPGVEMSQLHDEVTRVVQILPLETEVMYTSCIIITHVMSWAGISDHIV